MSSSSRPLGIALLGFGTVGGAVAEILSVNREQIREHVGREIIPVVASVRDSNKQRSFSPNKITTDAVEAATYDGVDIVVEVMGGLEPAKAAILAAIDADRPVVTANKELLAKSGQDLLGGSHSTPIYFEAAVGGGIPVIRTIRESLAGCRVTKIRGVLNGTTNYILTQMEESGATYAEALADAQKLGYAEAEPSSDVDGWDTLYKGVVLCGLAGGGWLAPETCSREGITQFTLEDLKRASSTGGAIKLVAEADVQAKSVKVSPQVLTKGDPLASLSGVSNGVVISTEEMPDIFLSGPGAGGKATAVSVIGDIISLAKQLP